MNGTDVYNILRDNGVNSLHHANTVTTSCTYLGIGGLASRGYVEDHHLAQTLQYSDNADKRLGIWYDIFLDGVDIHNRGRRRNDYGPVLFNIPISILKDLPPGTDVLVTRKNPVNWKYRETDDDHYFMTPSQLCDNYCYGDFGKHIIIRNQDGFLPFGRTRFSILLDDPLCTLASGQNAYTSAVQRLEYSALHGGLMANISKRICRPGCLCLSGHSRSYDQINMDLCF